MATTPDRMMFSSALERRFLCPGSARVEAAYPYDSTQSPEAAEGEMLHAATVAALTGKPFHKPLDDEQTEAVSVAAAAVLRLGESIGAKPADYAFEVKLDVPGRVNHPRIDILIIPEAGDTIAVVDLKFGRSMPDYPSRSWQIRDYAQASAQVYGARNVLAAIVAPRMAEDRQTVYHLFDTPSLEILRAEIDGIITDATKPDAPMIPGTKQCQWCRAAGTCEARKAIVAKVPKYLDLESEIKALNPDARARQYATALQAKAYIGKVCEAFEAFGLAGGSIAGWKIAEGSARRQWAGSAAAIASLRDLAVAAGKNPDDMIAPVGVTEAERILGKSKDMAAKLDALCVRVPGAQKLKRDAA